MGYKAYIQLPLAGKLTSHLVAPDGSKSECKERLQKTIAGNMPSYLLKLLDVCENASTTEHTLSGGGVGDGDVVGGIDPLTSNNSLIQCLVECLSLVPERRIQSFSEVMKSPFFRSLKLPLYDDFRAPVNNRKVKMSNLVNIFVLYYCNPPPPPVLLTTAICYIFTHLHICIYMCVIYDIYLLIAKGM